MSSRKSRIPKHLIRYGLVLLGTAAAVGCEGFVDPDSGSISLSIATTSATVLQGGSQPVTATLTRTGGFSGTIDLTVTGAPSGVTASVSNVQTTGAVTTATITILVGAGVAPAVYPLVVHGAGSGVGEVTQAFTLTVAAPPGYRLTLSVPTLSIAQATSSPDVTVYLARTEFTGNVTLSVENLPTGVSTYFYPDSPISGSSSQLALVAAGNAPPGTYTNLLVRGVASGLPDRTASLTLTITVAPFVFTLSSSTLSIAQGAATPTTTVNLVRHNFTGPVTLHVDVDGHGTMPAGVTAAFGPNPTTGTSSVLTLTVGAEVVPGVYGLWVYGEASTGWFDGVPLTLTVVADPGIQGIQQWATAATASSQYEDISWAARQATGAPDVVGCEDDVRAWASLEAGTEEWLELTYMTPVQPTMIRVYENWSPGSIVKVEVKDAAGQYTAVYTAQVTAPGCPHTLEIPVTGVMARISAVRISVDQSAHQDWNEIDAVQLVGRP